MAIDSEMREKAQLQSRRMTDEGKKMLERALQDDNEKLVRHLLSGYNALPSKSEINTKFRR